MPRERGRRGYVSSGRLAGLFVRQSARAAGANWLGGQATRRATRTIERGRNRARAVAGQLFVMPGRVPKCCGQTSLQAELSEISEKYRDVIPK